MKKRQLKKILKKELWNKWNLFIQYLAEYNNLRDEFINIEETTGITNEYYKNWVDKQHKIVNKENNLRMFIIKTLIFKYHIPVHYVKHLNILTRVFKHLPHFFYSTRRYKRPKRYKYPFIPIALLYKREYEKELWNNYYPELNKFKIQF